MLFSIIFNFRSNRIEKFVANSFNEINNWQRKLNKHHSENSYLHLCATSIQSRIDSQSYHLMIRIDLNVYAWIYLLCVFHFLLLLLFNVILAWHSTCFQQNRSICININQIVYAIRVRADMFICEYSDSFDHSNNPFRNLCFFFWVRKFEWFCVYVSNPEKGIIVNVDILSFSFMNCWSVFDSKASYDTFQRERERVREAAAAKTNKKTDTSDGDTWQLYECIHSFFFHSFRLHLLNTPACRYVSASGVYETEIDEHAKNDGIIYAKPLVPHIVARKIWQWHWYDSPRILIWSSLKVILKSVNLFMVYITWLRNVDGTENRDEMIESQNYFSNEPSVITKWLPLRYH